MKPKTRARRAIATGVHHWVRWRRARQRRLERERREKVTEMLERVGLVRRAKREAAVRRDVTAALQRRVEELERELAMRDAVQEAPAPQSPSKAVHQLRKTLERPADRPRRPPPPPTTGPAPPHPQIL